MRVLIRKKLDLSKPVNLQKLSPLEKVSAGFLSQLYNSKFYLRQAARERDAKILQQIQADESVKTWLLAHLYKELVQNKSFEGDTCASVIVSVDQKYETHLRRILPNVFDSTKRPTKDFIQYTIERVPENADIRRAFPNMPILLKASLRKL